MPSTKAEAEALGVSLEIVGDHAFVQPVQSSGAVGQGIHTDAAGTKYWQIPRSLTRDIAAYEAAKARAAAQGMELLIVPDGDEVAGPN